MTKLALLTGGTGGIGGATTAMLRERGWDVLTPSRNELPFDAGNVLSRYWLAPARRAHDHLSALIFCHGTWYSEPMWGQGPREWMGIYDSRVAQPFLIIQNHINPLRNAAGCVVMVASTQAFGGRAETGPYAAACAAQVRFMQGMAQSAERIRYNVVCPGLTDTRMAAQVRASGDCKPDAVAQPASAVAAAIVGLIEDGQSNGKVLRVVDGVTTEAKWSW